MSKTKFILGIIVLAIPSLAVRPALPQTLTKCRVQPRSLIPQKLAKPSRLSGPIPGNSSIEYHVKTRSDLNVDVRLSGGNNLSLDIYSVDPPKALSQNDKYTWSGTFSKDTEYVVAISNCSNRTATKFQLDLSSH